MEELVKEQRYNPDRSDPIVKFDSQSTIELIKAFEFMKVFKDTRDSNARKYCCILMFLILTTDIYIENMRRANWVESLKKKKMYIRRRVVSRGLVAILASKKYCRSECNTRVAMNEPSSTRGGKPSWATVTSELGLKTRDRGLSRL